MLTSRERLLRCINQKPVDRVPVSAYGLVGWNDNAWYNNEPSYDRLMDAIRKYTDCVYMLNPDIVPVREPALQISSWREGTSTFTRKVLHTKTGDLTALYRVDDNIHTVWTLKHFLEEIDDIDKYLSIPSTEAEYDMGVFFREQTKLSDKGIMMITVYDPIGLAAELFEMGNFLIYAITEPAKIKYFLDAIHERQMRDLKNLLKHDIKEVMFRICGSEYATPPYLPPEYFYNYATCYLKDICSEIKSAGGIPRIHCHGKIGKVLDQFADTEAVALDPIEPPPDGDISLVDVKKHYGKKFCLFGNIELKELETANEERMEMLIRHVLSDGMQHGGFVLMPTASPISVPLSKKTERNYLCMFDTACKYGTY